MTIPQFNTEEIEAQEWRPVVGYEEFYEVSNLGIVRSAIDRRNTKKGRELTIQWHCRYPDVSLRYPKGKAIRRQIHVLVAAAFLGKRPEGHEVNHIDGNKMNSRIQNLEYVTRLENNRHATRMGLRPCGTRSGRYTKPESFTHMRGQNINTSKLQPSDVVTIRELYASGRKIAQIARDLHVTWAAIKFIIIGRNWKHL